jgi:hypothetical protein
MNLVSDYKSLTESCTRRAVRYHWLVNPTGQEMKWRAVDWCVELNNLFTKVSKFDAL